MRTSTENWAEILTLTGHYIVRDKAIPDNIFDGVVLLEELQREGRVETYDGGDAILEPLMYAKNTSGHAYADMDVLDTTRVETITNAQYERKTYQAPVTLSGRDIRSDNPRAIKSVVKARIQMAQMAIRDRINTHLFLDGTSDDNNAIDGLKTYIAEDGLGTVGGIDASSDTWWKNYFQGAIGSASSNLLKYLRRAQIYGSRGRQSGRANLYIFTPNLYEAFETIQDSKQQYIMPATGPRPELNPASERLYWGRCPIGYDFAFPLDSGGKDQFVGLSTQYLKLRVHKDANFALGEFVKPANQDGLVAQVIFEGNLTCSNRRHLQRGFGIDV